MEQAEKALRDAGWEQVARSDVEPGEEYYDLQAGWVTKAGHALDGVPMQNYLVLRAPRPEPEYKPGTVVWANTSDGKQSLIAVGLPGAMRWIGKAENGLGAVYPEGVEVLRVIAYPDGTTPEPGPVTDEQLLAALNAAEERRGGKQWSSLGDFPPEIVEDRRYALEAARLTPVKAEENITLETIRETGRTAMDKYGDHWLWDEAKGFRITYNGKEWDTCLTMRLCEATAPGYFTHWAEDQENTQ